LYHFSTEVILDSQVGIELIFRSLLRVSVDVIIKISEKKLGSVFHLDVFQLLKMQRCVLDKSEAFRNKKQATVKYAMKSRIIFVRFETKET